MKTSDPGSVLHRMGRRRGVAMLEFTLVLPILIIILMLVIFFGHSMMRKQQVVVTDRHYAWRHAKRIPDPVNAVTNQIDYRLISDQNLNSEPVSLSIAGGSDTPREAPLGLVDAARGESAEAGNWANDVVLNYFPGDQSMQVGASYPRDTLPMDQFGRDIGDRYYREGVPWQHRDVSIWGKLRDHYISDFDTLMQQNNSGGGLIGVVRNLYLAQW